MQKKRKERKVWHTGAEKQVRVIQQDSGRPRLGRPTGGAGNCAVVTRAHSHTHGLHHEHHPFGGVSEEHVEPQGGQQGALAGLSPPLSWHVQEVRRTAARSSRDQGGEEYRFFKIEPLFSMYAI